MKNLHVQFDSRENEFSLYNDFTLLATAYSLEEIQEIRKEQEIENEIDCFESKGNEEFTEFSTYQLDCMLNDFSKVL